MNVLEHYQIAGTSSNLIARSIEDGIRIGRIPTGEHLPPIRALAARLGVSPATAAAAYRALRVRGLIRGSGRRGTVVNPRPALATPAPRPIPAGVRNLMEGNPDPRLMPRLGEVLRHIDVDAPLYGGAANLPELTRLAAMKFRADGISGDAIAIVSGAMDAIERVLAAHLVPGDRVGVEDPSYRGTLDLIAALGLVAEPIAIDDFGLIATATRRALDTGVRAIIVTPRGQNPTGCALDRKRAAELRAVLKHYPEVLVIEDDFTAAIAGVPCETLTLGRERWAVARSVSKALGPDLRIAVIAGDPLTIARVEGRQRLGARWVSHILQKTLIAMWSDPAVTRLVRDAAAAYAKRRDALVGELARRGVEAHGRSGLNVWVPVTNETMTVQLLLDAGWAVMAGESFRVASRPGIRVMTAALEPSEAPRLAEDIAAALRPRMAASAV